jgi:SAM-dependent methyltransferase
MTYGNPFGTSADRYAAGRPYHHERTVRRALGQWRPGSALDVACGTGLSTRALAALGIPVLGLDVAVAMVARARADTGLPYAVGSGEALPVAAGAVGLVTVGSGVHWFDQERFAAEAARVLRPGGRLLLYEHAGPMPPAEPEFRRWLRVDYLGRYPAPPRGAMAADFDGGGRFGPPVTQRWPDEIPFTRDGFAAYLATQSNTLDRPAEETLDWLRAGLTPYFPAAGTRPITFQASYRLLERTAL